jgi:hypothetical protein
MTSLHECSARAELCRRFARLEPNSKNLWLSEAERWSHLTVRKPGGRSDTASQPKYGRKEALVVSSIIADL